MLFNSLQFLIFFPIVVILFFSLPNRARNWFLLVASYWFYMSWKPEYIVLILLSTVVTFYCGYFMSKTNNELRRKALLALNLIINLGILFFFKYFNFFNTFLGNALREFNVNWGVPNFSILLPVGISFYTFQALGYSIDVYRRTVEPEKNFFTYALFVSFFPQLVAGPIERTGNLLPQFYEHKRFDCASAAKGLGIMLWGLFKKVVIADRLAVLVNIVYADPSAYSGVYLIGATVFFALQIYCDFSGYSDIAMGCAQVMGFRLMSNFERPYFAKSIAEFWKRWHISLSTWFKDYLYISLGGNRVASKGRLYFNLFFTFLVSGLWHGANWTFVLWGALNGFYLVFSRMTERWRNIFNAKIGLTKLPHLHGALKIATTFFLACVAWVFFRAKNVNEAFYILHHSFADLFFGTAQTNSVATSGGANAGLSGQLYIAAMAVAILLIYEIIQERYGNIFELLTRMKTGWRWAFYYLLIVVIILFGVFEQQQFIYFQF